MRLFFVLASSISAHYYFKRFLCKHLHLTKQDKNIKEWPPVWRRPLGLALLHQIQHWLSNHQRVSEYVHWLFALYTEGWFSNKSWHYSKDSYLLLRRPLTDEKLQMPCPNNTSIALAQILHSWDKHCYTAFNTQPVHHLLFTFIVLTSQSQGYLYLRINDTSD